MGNWLYCYYVYAGTGSSIVSWMGNQSWEAFASYMYMSTCILLQYLLSIYYENAYNWRNWSENGIKFNIISYISPVIDLSGLNSWMFLVRVVKRKQMDNRKHVIHNSCTNSQFFAVSDANLFSLQLFLLFFLYSYTLLYLLGKNLASYISDISAMGHIWINNMNILVIFLKSELY